MTNCIKAWLFPIGPWTYESNVDLPPYLPFFCLIQFVRLIGIKMELWMTVVGVSMALSGLPQGYRMWRRKTSDDISITLWVIVIHGIMWWLYYGIMIDSISLIITNSVCLVLDSAILMMVVRYKTKPKKSVQPTQKDGRLT